MLLKSPTDTSICVWRTQRMQNRLIESKKSQSTISMNTSIMYACYMKRKKYVLVVSLKDYKYPVGG